MNPKALENAAQNHLFLSGPLEFPLLVAGQNANGARLTLEPKDSGKLDEFRNSVRQHAEQMKKHDCSMMQGMMQGMMGGMNPQPPANPEPKPKPKTDETDHSAHHPGEK